MATQGVPQRTQGEGKEATHTHPAVTHSYDHYRVTPHHVGAVPGKVVDGDHRTCWHTHAELTHSHDYGPRTRTDTTPRSRTCTTTPRRPTPSLRAMTGQAHRPIAGHGPWYQEANCGLTCEFRRGDALR